MDGMQFVFEPGSWEVHLVGGWSLQIRADGFSEESGEVVFTTLMAGQPNYEFVVARLPAAAVAGVFGGPV